MKILLYIATVVMIYGVQYVRVWIARIDAKTVIIPVAMHVDVKPLKENPHIKDMTCTKCKVQFGYHKFVMIGTVNDTMLIYSSPAKSPDFNEDGTKLENIRCHIEEYKRPWIWIFDGAGMGFQDYTDVSFNMGLLNILSSNTYIQGIWVTRSNIWLRTSISFMQTISSAPILKKIKYMDGNIIEIHDAFRKEGVETHSIIWILNEQDN
jgi:hypothetical protein